MLQFIWNKVFLKSILGGGGSTKTGGASFISTNT